MRMYPDIYEIQPTDYILESHPDARWIINWEDDPGPSLTMLGNYRRAEKVCREVAENRIFMRGLYTYVAFETRDDAMLCLLALS